MASAKWIDEILMFEAKRKVALLERYLDLPYANRPVLQDALEAARAEIYRLGGEN